MKVKKMVAVLKKADPEAEVMVVGALGDDPVGAFADVRAINADNVDLVLLYPAKMVSRRA